MTISKLSETTSPQVQKLLETCGISIIKQASTSFSLECPECQKKEAYIYFNGGTRKVECNRRNNCKVSIELWDLIAEKIGIDRESKYEILKYINSTLGLPFNDKIYTKIQEVKAKEQEEQGFLIRCSHVFKNKFNNKEDKKVELAWQYLQKRGYTDKQIQKFDLGFFLDKGELIQRLEEDYNYTARDLKKVDDYFAKVFYELANEKDESNQHRLVFTCYNIQKEVAGFVVRRVSDDKLNKAKYLNSAGYQKSKHLFNFQNFKEKKIVIVEGQFDALAGTFLTPQEINKQYCFVATGGNTISEEQVRLLQNEGISEVIILKDNDKAGENYKKSVAILIKHGIRTKIAYIPENYKDIKDIDELLRKHPDCELNLILQQADGETQEDLCLGEKRELALTQFRANGISNELIAEIEGLARKEKERRTEKEFESRKNEVEASIGNAINFLEVEKAINDYQRLCGDDDYTVADFLKYLASAEGGISTGIEELDKQSVFFQPSSLAFVAGRTGHGKTTVLLNMLVQSIINNPDKSYCYCSYEEDEGQIINKIILIVSKEKDTNIAGQYNNYFYNVQNYLKYRANPKLQRTYGSEIIETAYMEVMNWIGSYRLRILKKEQSVEDLQNKLIVRATKSKKPMGLVFVDYLQMLGTNKKHRKTSTRQVELQEVCNVLLDTAHQIKIPLVLGAQMNREAKEDDGIGGLTLDKIRECGDIEQHANLVLGVWDETQYRVLKAEKAIASKKTPKHEIKTHDCTIAEAPKAEERKLTIKVLKNRNGQRLYKINIEVINDLFKIPYHKISFN